MCVTYRPAEPSSPKAGRAAARLNLAGLLFCVFVQRLAAGLMMGFMERSAKRRDDGWRLRESRLQMKPSELSFELTTTFDGFLGVIVP